MAAAFFSITGCHNAPAPAASRIVLLPFENLTGDASLDWVSNAAPGIVAEDLSGSTKVAPLRAATMGDAYLERATQIVHGYFTGSPNALHFQIETEDAARHKMSGMVTEQGSVLLAMNAAANAIVPGAHSFSSTNAEAVSAWGQGDNERAVKLDPDFGAAWLGWAQSTERSGDREHAIQITQQALDRESLKSESDRARIELLAAELHQDALARAKALAHLYRLSPDDPAVLTVLADAEVLARDFVNAALHMRALVQLNPSNANVLNSLGYAEGFAGDLAAAHDTFERYGQAPNQKGNSLDSWGETLFMHGKFADAEAQFLSAHRTNPAQAQGEDLLKAAYSHWLAHDQSTADLKAADAEFADYLKFRANQHDPQLAWREASWLWSTGRRPQAMAKLAEVPNKQLVAKQTAVWKSQFQLPKDLDALRKHYYATQPFADGQVRLIYAAALITSGGDQAQKDEGRALLKLWPMPWSAGDAVLDSWVIPEYLELRTAAGMPAH